MPISCARWSVLLSRNQTPRRGLDDGIPLAVLPSAANVHDTRFFPDLRGLAQVAWAAIGKLSVPTPGMIAPIIGRCAYARASNHTFAKRACRTGPDSALSAVS